MDQTEIDALPLMHKTREQSLVTDRVHQPRNPFAVLVNAPERRARERRNAVAAAEMQTMLDVMVHFLAAERPKMIADGDSLPELTQAGFVEPVTQLGLAHEHNLQELAVVGLQV